MAKRTIILFVTALLLAGITSVAQDVQFQGSARPVVGVGETFNLTYSVNAQGTNFRGPSMANFSLLSGPNMSTASSIQSVNGRTSMTVTYSFTYYLMAMKEGNFEIPAASITVDKKEYKSNAVVVKVVKSSGGSQGSPNAQGGNQAGKNQQSIQTGPNDVFLKAFASKSDPMQGEGIVVTYKIYTKLQIAQIAPKKISSFAGFWSQNLIKENDKLSQTTQVIDGQKYVVADIRKIALYPLKSGKLVIDPFELDCQAQVVRQTRNRTGDPFFDDFFNDSFFNNSYATIEKSLKSNPLVINVKPLPDQDKPSDFSGAVGKFDFKTEVDKTALKTNDAFTLKCIVSGEGNIQLIDKLAISFPPDFETYDPKVTSNINTSAAGITGSQTFEYLVIPRKPGKFLIKPITFSYFDLARKKYVTITSPSYTINVEKGSGDNNSVVYTGANKEDIKYIGTDIRHIKNQAFSLQESGTFFFFSPVFFILLLLPVLIFIGVILVWRKQVARRSDTMLMKNRKATKIAKKRLTKAFDFMKKNKEADFYIEISQALWGYLSDKFGIPLSELSIESVNEALVRKQLKEELISQFIETLNNTEFARFAPGEKSQLVERTYNEALDIITRIEKELRVVR